MEDLQARCTALEQQMRHLLQHIGTSQGEVFASAQKVSLLEAKCAEHERTISTLKQTQSFFQTNLETYFQAQLDDLIAKRGIRATEYASLTKIFAAHLTNAVQTLQTTHESLLKQALQTDTIQGLQIELQRLKSSSKAQPLSIDAETIQSFQIRLQLLELQVQPNQISGQINQPNNQQIDMTPIQSTLDTLQQRVQQVEQSTLTQIQQYQSMTRKGGELAVPFSRLQNTVEELQREWQAFRGVDPRRIAESVLHTGLKQMRAELETHTQSTATKVSVDTLKEEIQRIESFSRDVQTSFYKMRGSVEAIAKDLQTNYTNARWKQFEQSVKQSLEATQQEQLSVWNHILATQQSTLESTTKRIESEVDGILARVNYVTNPDWIQKQVKAIRSEATRMLLNHLADYQSNHQSQWTKFEEARYVMQSKILECESLVKTELEASELKKRYAEFDKQLHAMNKTLGSWSKRIHEAESKQSTILDQTFVHSQHFQSSLREMEKELVSLQNTVQTEKQMIRETIQSWLHGRQTAIQQVFGEATEQVHNLGTYVKGLEIQLVDRVQAVNQQTDGWNKQFGKLEEQVHQRLEEIRQTQVEYLVQRVLEISKDTKEFMEQAKSVEAFYEIIVQRAEQASAQQFESFKTSVHELATKHRNDSLQIHQEFRTQIAQLRTSIAKDVQTELLTEYRSELNKYIQVFQELMTKQLQAPQQQVKSYQQQTTKLTEVDGWTKCILTTRIQTDEPLQPILSNPGWDWICFTDQPNLEPNGWHVVEIELDSTATAYEAKQKTKWSCKTTYIDYDVVVWLEPHVQLNRQSCFVMRQWIQSMFEKEIVLLHGRSKYLQLVTELVEPNERLEKAFKEANVPKQTGVYDTSVVIFFPKRKECEIICKAIQTTLQTVTSNEQICLPIVYSANQFTKFTTVELGTILDPPLKM